MPKFRSLHRHISPPSRMAAGARLARDSPFVSHPCARRLFRPTLPPRSFVGERIDRPSSQTRCLRHGRVRRSLSLAAARSHSSFSSSPSRSRSSRRDKPSSTTSLASEKRPSAMRAAMNSSKWPLTFTLIVAMVLLIPNYQNLGWAACVTDLAKDRSSPSRLARTGAGRHLDWFRFENGKLRTTTTPFTNRPRPRPPRGTASPGQAADRPQDNRPIKPARQTRGSRSKS